jgi:hypothetical protein
MDACEVWLRLLARLEHMRVESGRPSATKLYKRLGSRCLKNAQRQLCKEREALLIILGRWGLAIPMNEVLATANGLELMDDLESDCLLLSNGYRCASGIAERWRDPAAAEWLLERAHIRDQQRFFLRF